MYFVLSETGLVTLALKGKYYQWLIISVTVRQEEAITDRMLGVSTAPAIVIRSFYCRNGPIKTTARFLSVKAAFDSPPVRR